MRYSRQLMRIQAKRQAGQRCASRATRGSVFRVGLTLAFAVVIAGLAPRAFPRVSALGELSRFDVRAVDYEGGNPNPRKSAPRRLAWEVRKRTSIDTLLEPTRARLDDRTIFETPFLYWSGDSAFPPLSEAEIVGLRRFVELGGFVLIDDASDHDDGFDGSIRRALVRAFPGGPLVHIARDHTVFRSFYLLGHPSGRVAEPDYLEGINVGERLAVLYSRHDLGGAWARDNLGTWEYPVVPGGDAQRELAIRLGVNVIMYVLCLDYKDDQVHAPFIMRRRGGAAR